MLAREPVVRRYHDPSDEQTQHLKERAEPFLITGRMQQWPLFQRLERTSAFREKLRCFADIAPARPVQFSRLPRRKASFTFADGPDGVFRLDHVPLLDFVRLVDSAQDDPAAGTLYMQAQAIPECRALLPELYGAGGPSAAEAPRFWLGSGGQSTALHNDRYRNSIAVFMGSKRVWLFPPTQLGNLYIAPLDRRIQGAVTSLVDPRAPDFDRFPKLRAALPHMLVADVARGEILYIPPLWWHLVQSFDVNLSANQWLDDVPDAAALYEPASLGLLGAGIHSQPARVRGALSKLYGEAIRGRAEARRADVPFAAQVLAAARGEALLLSRIPHERARVRWTDWIACLADSLLFQVEESP